MLKISEYAKSRGISYEAVRSSIAKYKTELTGHISKQGRTRYLDDIAVEILDSHRQVHTIEVMDSRNDLTEKDEIISNLKDEIIRLQSQIMELQEYKQKAIESNIRLEIASENTAKLQAELDRYKPTIFGLYKRTK